MKLSCKGGIKLESPGNHIARRLCQRARRKMRVTRAGPIEGRIEGATRRVACILKAPDFLPQHRSWMAGNNDRDKVALSGIAAG
jgi:hypothetical protein